MEDPHLKKLEKFAGRDGPLVLIVTDGIGLGKNNDRNAFYLANTPFLKKLQRICTQTQQFAKLKAHGTAIGLPTDIGMGNCEIGHNIIGAGCVIKQRAFLAKEAIESKNMFYAKKWFDFTNVIKNYNKTLHIIGLLSDGYVHSHISHLIGLLHGAITAPIYKIRIHVILDGIDVQPQSALLYIGELERELKRINEKGIFDYKIASGGGRVRVAMDRYNSDWNLVRKAWEALVCGIPERFPNYKGYFNSAQSAITQARIIDPKNSDQFLPLFVIVNENKFPMGKMEDGDGVIFFNFRGEGAVQISRAFDEGENFKEFVKKCNPIVQYYGLFQYDEKLRIPKNYFLDPSRNYYTISDYLSAEGIRQFAIAETPKYEYLTYYWKGTRDLKINGEDCMEIKSDLSEKVEEHPEMKAAEVEKALIIAIMSNEYKFLRVNFANGDIVGHTGNKVATMIAAETVDKSVSEIVEVVNKKSGITIVTADHGNIDDMDKFKASNTLNPVMFAIVDSGYNKEYVINDEIKEPGLGNIAATILNLLGYEKPENYLESLIKFLR